MAPQAWAPRCNFDSRLTHILCFHLQPYLALELSGPCYKSRSIAPANQALGLNPSGSKPTHESVAGFSSRAR
ncbi:hypothetical protein N7475_000908 [Penicillium sp. IBT 31633x]|nr:hypothetical protein N7475_000908 [Penicillium sp. IBT 31633x]